jgi:3',5'-cyclic AMP phosphodiesterase CpdA
MRIFHFSDTHVGDQKDYNDDVLSRLIEKINSENFDVAILTGDITQSGKEEEYKKAKKILSRIKIPLIVLPGNHDARSGGIHLFEKHIGPSNGVREIDEAVVIYVNSAVSDSNEGRIGIVKFDMMRKALNNYSDKKVKILALHHHILPIPWAGRERNVLFNAGDILDLIRRSDVDLVLLGHRHYPNVYNIGGTVFLNAGTASSKKRRYGDVNSYSIIEVDENVQRTITRRVDGREQIKEYPRTEKRVFYDFGERKFRIVQISNTFISKKRVFLKEHFVSAMQNIHDLNPDLFVHCGGIVNEGISEDYELAADYFSKLELPVVFTPAGRDINYLGYRLFTDYFGPFDQSFSNENIILQGVSSAQYDSTGGIIGETERKALFSRLKKFPGKFRGIFLHHNVLPIPHSREKGLLEDSGDLLKGIVENGINLVLTGTSSHPFAQRVEGTLVVNANSLSSVYQRSLFGNSFNLIDIYEKVIAVFDVNSLWKKRRLLGLWELK